MYEPSLMRGRDFKINDKITIHMPSVGDIIDYGEQKYFQLVYLFCSTSSDYKAQLDSVGIDWQKISDFEMFRQLFIGNKDQDTLHPHDFRHSGATLLKNAGMSLEDVSSLLNHAGTDVTNKYYIKKDTTKIQSAKDRFEI